MASTNLNQGQQETISSPVLCWAGLVKSSLVLHLHVHNYNEQKEQKKLCLEFRIKINKIKSTVKHSKICGRKNVSG